MANGSARFAGFPAEALAFFRGLEKRNTREWFQPRKSVYEEMVRAPMTALVEEVNRELVRAGAPEYVTGPAKAIYRIYRDTRFSADKTPYKTHIAAVFPRRGLEKHAGAGLYFSVSHKEIEVAGGVYMPGPEQLLAIRTYLAEKHEEFRRVIANKTLRALMGELYGASLSRVPKGFPADHPAADLIKRKQWLFYVLLDPGLAATPELVQEIAKRFRVMIPFVELLNAPLVARRLAQTKAIELNS
jgi:uncharacterized protein (TIGR02453 family)